MMIPNDAHWLMMVPRISNWGVTALITRLLLGCITHAFGGPRSLAANVFKVFNVKRKTVESYMLKKKNEATLEKWGICSLVTRGAWRKAKVSPCFLSLIFLAIIRDVTNLDMQCCILLQSKDAYFSCRNFWSAHLHVFYLFAGYLNKILSKVLQVSWEDLGSPEVECRTSFQTMSEHVRTL
jgi:hypothetical protein